MTKIRTTLAGLDSGAVLSATERLRQRGREENVAVDVTDHESATPTDLKESLTDGPVAATSLWVYSLPEASRWDLHGEACRRIVEDEDRHPEVHGAHVALTVRYGAGAKDVAKTTDYPPSVVAVLSVEEAPPAILNSAPFSYNPHHDYYTEVHQESGAWTT